MSRGADIPECRTADGVVVKRGDVAWRVRCWGMPTRSKVTRDPLKVWAMWSLTESVYADEQAALRARLASAQRDLDKAKRDARTASRTIARIRERLP